MLCIGIDPGLSGAIAAIDGAGTIELHDIPIVERVKMRKGNKPGIKREYDLAKISSMLRQYKARHPNLVIVIEEVHAMPPFFKRRMLNSANGRVEVEERAQGTVSMFSMGEGFMLWKAMAAALEIPIERFSPQSWKKIMMQGLRHSDKNASRLRAQQLFPKVADQLGRKKDDGRAEALLIAEFGRRVKSGIMYR